MTQNSNISVSGFLRFCKKHIFCAMFYVVFFIFVVFSLFCNCVITFEPIMMENLSAPQNDHLNPSFVKYILVVGEKMTKKGRKIAIYQSRKFG